MENKKAAGATGTAFKPLSMCEKLFTAFQPTLRPLRRVTFRQQETAAVVPSDKHSHAQVGPPAKGKHNHKPKAQEKERPLSAPPKAEVMPLGAVPLPQPPRPPAATAEAHKPKKGFNERVDDYITRTKDRIRSVSAVGRAPSTEWIWSAQVNDPFKYLV